MDRRMLTFIMLAVPIYVLGMIWMQRNQQMQREALEAYEAQQREIAGVVEEPDGLTTGTATAPRATIGPVEGEAPQAEDYSARRPAAPVEPVVVQSKSYRITFSPAGGVPVAWAISDPAVTHALDPDLLQTPEADDEATTEGHVLPEVQLIDVDLDEAGLNRPLEIVLKEQNARYYSEFNNMIYESEVEETEDGTVVRFTSPPNDQGLRLIKTYRIPERGFLTELSLTFENTGGSRLVFNNQGTGLGLTMGPGLNPPLSEGAGGFGDRYSFTEAIYKEDGEILKLRPKRNEPESFVAPSGDVPYAGLHSRYFLYVALPDATTAAGQGYVAGKTRLDTKVVEAALANKDTLAFYPRLEVYSEPFQIEPGEQKTFSYTMFAGPKDRQILQATGLGLEEVLFFDSWEWMRMLAIGLMYLLGVFHGMFGNWGVAIIVLVILVRLVTLPLTQIQLKHQATAQAEMAKIKPHIDKLNEKYKDNPTKRNQEMMKLYREHNINPLGMFRGCIWMVIQLPIFFALYKLLSQSFDLRGAEFLWIEDLSQPDHLFHLGFSLPFLGEYLNLLPILTAGTQLFVSRMMMSNSTMMTDSTQAAMQKQMMYMMPVFILLMTYTFPSGLVLYWFVSNVWQLFQQQFVNKKILGKPAEAAAAAT